LFLSGVFLRCCDVCMSIKEFTDYVTLVGAVIAAGVGVWNLVLQMRGKRGQFFVRLGSLSPTIEEETMLSVVIERDISQINGHKRGKTE